MNGLTLVIGNKNYSSWSLRPWLAMKQMGVKFTEKRIPLYTSTASQEISQYTPAGKVPILIDGDINVWDSLAICEYLMERFPALSWLPKERAARAIARSVGAEMHSGFLNLRTHLPMNCRAKVTSQVATPEVASDVERITSIWRGCRQQFGQEGEFLFGKFSLADAMFAPVVSRFETYGVELDSLCQNYSKTILELPAMQEWIAAARTESEVIDKFEL